MGVNFGIWEEFSGGIDQKKSTERLFGYLGVACSMVPRRKYYIFWLWVNKGDGGSEVDFHFFIVSDRGECQLTGTFFGMKKYCS